MSPTCGAPTTGAAICPSTQACTTSTRSRYEYYRDRTLELEALLAGTIDFREEFTSKDWATGYDRKPVKDGRVKLLTLPDERPSGAQGFFINTRRDKFRDVRVREALGLAFDFEWANKNLFYGTYTRTASYFEQHDLGRRAAGRRVETAGAVPQRAAAGAVHRAVSPPVTDGSGNNREQLRHALDLLQQAGWSVKERKMVQERRADQLHHPAERPLAGARGAALCASRCRSSASRRGYARSIPRSTST